jgi:predicted nucleic acid-binding protein
VDEGIIREAFELHSPDFEDSVTAVAAQRAGCDLIVTRDPKGFRGSLVSVLAPEAVAPLLG